MNVDRITEIAKRLRDLFEGGGTPDAIRGELNSLESAIAELRDRPQTHADTRLISPRYEWKVQEQRGYYETPMLREDGRFMVVRPNKAKVWYVMEVTKGDYVMDSLNRKRFWKHSRTAMAYIDRDFPINVW